MDSEWQEVRAIQSLLQRHDVHAVTVTLNLVGPIGTGQISVRQSMRQQCVTCGNADAADLRCNAGQSATDACWGHYWTPDAFANLQV
jgi:hypothetical protein